MEKEVLNKCLFFLKVINLIKIKGLILYFVNLFEIILKRSLGIFYFFVLRMGKLVKCIRDSVFFISFWK